MRPNSGSNSRKAKAKGGKPRASVTLKELVDFGVILPGRNKISVSYKGINYLANLGKDGVIMYQGEAVAAMFAHHRHVSDRSTLSWQLLSQQECLRHSKRFCICYGKPRQRYTSASSRLPHASTQLCWLISEQC